MSAPAPIRLGVNIDHVATVRNARGGRHPDPVQAAEIAIAAGADGITAHLREDRRHIVDDDIARLKARINKPLNLEMAATRRDGRHRAASCGRTPPASFRNGAQERTTEGGLDAAGQRESLRARGRRTGRRRHPRLAVHRRRAGADRGRGRDRRAGDRDPHRRLVRCARGRRRGRAPRRNSTASRAAPLGAERRPRSPCRPRPRLSSPRRRSPTLAEIVELNIGHFLIGEAIFDGLGAAVRHDARGHGPRPARRPERVR